LRKESTRYVRVNSTPVATVAGSRRPSSQTGYAQELRGISIEKAYGDLGHRKGINKRPRRKLTLGNMVMRKKRKRVEGMDSKPSSQLGNQRLRQRIRGFWDRRNLERRKVQRTYREAREPTQGSQRGEVRGNSALIRARKRYRRVREVEVYRNAYERRSRYQTHERGKRRKKGWVEEKYGTPARGKAKRGETGVEERRARWKQEEARDLEANHRTQREEIRADLVKKVERRQEVWKTETQRQGIEHLNTLRDLCVRTRLRPRQVKNREKWRPGAEESGKDSSREILMAVPTTQYFSKRKNFLRRVELESGKREAKKWRKIPEKERTERHPDWSEREAWTNRRRKEVEDENRKGLLQGKGGSLSGSYVEFGKKVVYLYATERSERWNETKKNKEKASSFREKPEKKNESANPIETL